MTYVDTLKVKQNDCHFEDDNSKWILQNDNISIPINISLIIVLSSIINSEQCANIDLSNELAQNRRHAIIWTIDDADH